MTGSILFDVPAEEYHRREPHTVSKSALDQMDRSPAHYRAWLGGLQQETTPALAFGTAAHMALLEPELYSQRYAVEPDFGDCRYKQAKADRDAWRAANAGRELLSDADFHRIRKMVAAIHEHPAASRLVADGRREVTLRWVDEVSGLRCKSRADIWVPSKRIAVDMKTTEDASPEAFSRSVTRWRYFVQDALYRMGFAACGEPITHFAILAVEKEPPYAVAVYTLDEEAVAKGYDAARRDIERIRECIERDHWPAYSDGIEDLSLPPWAA